MAWSKAVLGRDNAEPFLKSISKASLALISDFWAQHLSNTPWSYANILFIDEPLLSSISAKAIPRL